MLSQWHHSDFAKVSPLAPKEHLIELLAERNEFEKHLFESK